MANLGSMLCSCHRTIRYYFYHDQRQKPCKDKVTKDYGKVDFVTRRHPSTKEVDVELIREKIASRASDLVFGQALNFLNYFAEIGGFNALIKAIEEGNKVKNESDEMMPLELLGDLTGAFVNCGALLHDEFAASFVQKVEDVVTKRLLEMSEKEIKELDKDCLPSVLAQLRQFLQIKKGDAEISELIEQIQLSFAARFLKTTFLEKRLKGVSDIRHLIERVGAKDQLAQQRLPQGQMQYIIGPGGGKIRPTQFLDSSKLKAWLIQGQVAETIFGEAAHPEILKRAAPLLRFLSH